MEKLKKIITLVFIGTITAFCGTSLPNQTAVETIEPTITTSTPSKIQVSPITQTAVIAIHDYIGLVHPPLPSFLTTSTSSAALISPSTTSESWSIKTVTDGKNFMLWFSKVLYRDDHGKAYFQVGDVAVIPPTERNQYVVVSACLNSNVLDSEIVALVRVDEESLQERYLSNSNVILAWRANQSTGEIIQISTFGIECYAETFLSFP